MVLQTKAGKKGCPKSSLREIWSTFAFQIVPRVIIKTGVGTPTLVFLSSPGFFSFFLPCLLSCPYFSFLSTFTHWFFTFTHPCLGFFTFSSLVFITYISQPWFFTFVNPWLLFSPGFSYFPSLIYHTALGFLLPTLSYYSALFIRFFPPLAIIMPWACFRQERVINLCASV